jgi:uncharacterized DUF497 family protein
MPDAEEMLMRSYGRAFKMVEAWVTASLVDEIREALKIVIGDLPERRLVSVLSSTRDALPLSVISARCGVSRRAVLESGKLRLALIRMEKSRILVNLGTAERPRYRLNSEEPIAKLVASLFSETGTSIAEF